jgi:hypothetical protein
VQRIVEYAKSEGLKRISGQALQENSAMLNICRKLDFAAKSDAADHTSLRCDTGIKSHLKTIGESR